MRPLPAPIRSLNPNHGDVPLMVRAATPIPTPFGLPLAAVSGLILLATLEAGRPAPAQASDVPPAPRTLEWIRPSQEKSHFVREGTDERVVMWGFNYDHDDAGRLLEDYWDEGWSTVVEDFREMKALGANVVRVHLQLPRFMDAPDQPDAASLARLGRLVPPAGETALSLNVT